MHLVLLYFSNVRFLYISFHFALQSSAYMLVLLLLLSSNYVCTPVDSIRMAAVPASYVLLSYLRIPTSFIPTHNTENNYN